MTSSVRVALLALVVLAVGGCATSGAGSGSASAEPPVAEETTLDGTGWRAVLVDGLAVVAANPPTAAFANGNVAGTTGCNEYAGSYRLGGGGIEFGDLVSTKIGCEGPISTVEQRFLKVLDGATSVGIDGNGRLIITGPGGEAIFEAAVRAVPE